MATDTVWICEKPKAAKALADVFGVVAVHKTGWEGWIETRRGAVTWGRGHMVRAKQPGAIDPKWGQWSLASLPVLPDAVATEVDPEMRRQVELIRKLVAKARRVVLATDWDREGCLLGNEIVEACGRGFDDRLALRSVEPSDIKAEIAAMERNRAANITRHHAMALEAAARAYADYCEGMTFTRAATLALPAQEMARDVLHYGPVQTALVALVVERERAIREHVPRDYYRIRAEVRSAAGHGLAMSHAPGVNSRTGEDYRLYDAGLAERIRAAAAAFRGPLRVEASAVQVQPPRPFSQTSLQSAAGRAFGWSPSKTLELAQSIYDKGLITYPRTPCQYYPGSRIDKIEPILQALRDLPELAALLPARPEIRHGSRYNDEKTGAHEAIGPTGARPTGLSADEAKLYGLIATNWLANHLPAGIDDRTRIAFAVAVDGVDREFTATGRVERSAGWRAVKGAGAVDDEDDEAQDKGSRLPPVTDGEEGEVTKAAVDPRRTEPPERFLLTDLTAVMGNLKLYISDPRLKAALTTDDPDMPKGLGTDATRAAHLLDVMDTTDPAVKKAMDGKDGDPRKRYLTLARGTRQVMPTPKAFFLIGAYERVHPPFAGYVARAEREYELSRIGAAASRAEAEERHAVYVETVKRDVLTATEHFRRASRLRAEDIPHADGYGEARVSDKMIALARTIARDRGLKLPDVSDHAAVKAFLDTHARKHDADEPATERQLETIARYAADAGLAEDEWKRALTFGEARALLDRVMGAVKAGQRLDGGVVAMSEAQMRAVEKAAEKGGAPLPDDWRDRGRAWASAYLDAAFGDKGGRKGAGRATGKAGGGRSPGRGSSRKGGRSTVAGPRSAKPSARRRPAS